MTGGKGHITLWRIPTIVVTVMLLLMISLNSVEGRVIPTELRADALELKKAMKYDDSEREGDSIAVTTIRVSAQMHTGVTRYLLPV